jgi:hypothetical protein
MHTVDVRAKQQRVWEHGPDGYREDGRGVATQRRFLGRALLMVTQRGGLAAAVGKLRVAVPASTEKA